MASRRKETFSDRGSALGRLFERAGEAPRLLAYEEEVGCPLHTALSVLEWTGVVGLLRDDDLLLAARLTGEIAAAVVERRDEAGKRIYLYYGPRMDAPIADPHEGSVVLDQPGVRGIEFAHRAHSLAHFLRSTQGVGAVISFLSRRAPELRHVKRWLGILFQEPSPDVSHQMLAGWFATTSAGLLFAPMSAGGPFVYEEVGNPEG